MVWYGRTQSRRHAQSRHVKETLHRRRRMHHVHVCLQWDIERQGCRVSSQLVDQRQDQCVTGSASSCLPCSDTVGWTSHPTSRPTFFTNLSHHRLPSGHRTDSSALWLVRFFWASRFLFFVSSLFVFVWFRVADLAGYMLAFGRT